MNHVTDTKHHNCQHPRPTFVNVSMSTAAAKCVDVQPVVISLLQLWSTWHAPTMYFSFTHSFHPEAWITGLTHFKHILRIFNNTFTCSLFSFGVFYNFDSRFLRVAAQQFVWPFSHFHLWTAWSHYADNSFHSSTTHCWPYRLKNCQRWVNFMSHLQLACEK